jgi:hypothetical protein
MATDELIEEKAREAPVHFENPPNPAPDVFDKPTVFARV